MVDLDQLAIQARRAAEQGRMLMATRVTIAIAPLATASLLVVEQTVVCVTLAAALLASSIVLRWRDRRGIDAVRLGLVMGAIPLAMGLLVCGCDTGCEPSSFAHADLICVLAGAGAGAGVAFGSYRAGKSSGQWLRTTLVASLTASIGCVGLGAGGILLGVSAIVIGGLVVRVPLALRANA